MHEKTDAKDIMDMHVSTSVFLFSYRAVAYDKYW